MGWRMDNGYVRWRVLKTACVRSRPYFSLGLLLNSTWFVDNKVVQYYAPSLFVFFLWWNTCARDFLAAMNKIRSARDYSRQKSIYWLECWSTVSFNISGLRRPRRFLALRRSRLGRSPWKRFKSRSWGTSRRVTEAALLSEDLSNLTTLWRFPGDRVNISVNHLFLFQKYLSSIL